MADAGVVDEDVEAAELRDGGGDGVGAGDIEVEGAAQSRVDRARASAAAKIDVGDPDEGAGANEFFDGGFADAAGAAGDECVAAVESRRLAGRRIWRSAHVKRIPLLSISLLC